MENQAESLLLAIGDAEFDSLQVSPSFLRHLILVIGTEYGELVLA